jgi:hypothetical protein
VSICSFTSRTYFSVSGQYGIWNLLYFKFYLAVCSIPISVLKVVTNLDGEFICQVGSSEEGLVDGQFDTASFNRPQVRSITMLCP